MLIWEVGSFFSYDPEYQHWDFGKISALHEAQLALEAGYEFYYMGRSCRIRRPVTLLTVTRLLHTFLYKNAIQSHIFTNLYAR
jgi:Arginine-tRNA-protein transferase, C terminus